MDAASAEETGDVIIRVTRPDVEGADHVGERIYITIDTPGYGRTRVWVGPKSFQALRDIVGQDGEAWCEVPEEQVQREDRAGASPELEDSEDVEDLDELGSMAGIVVLMDTGDEPERLFVIPVDVACAELRTYATLRHARTYRDVLADDGAVKAVVEALGRRLDERDEDDEDLEDGLSARELFDRRVAEDASFSTDAVLGEKGWREWCPDHRAATEGFARGSAPRLWERFSEGDSGWGIDYDPIDYLPAAEQDQILARIQTLGCEILPCPGLDQQYWNPDRDLVARIDAGEWPPKCLFSCEYSRPEIPPQIPPPGRWREDGTRSRPQRIAGERNSPLTIGARDRKEVPDGRVAGCTGRGARRAPAACRRR